MYLLPVTTYSDYWRATRTWSSYIGGLAVLAVGTQYSTLTTSDKTQTTQLPVQVAKQSLDSKESGLDVGFSEFRLRALNQNSRGILAQGKISRGLAGRGTVSQGVLDKNSNSLEEKVIQEVGTGQEVSASKGVEIGQEAIVTQEASNRLTSTTKIEDKEIPFETQYVESDELLPGKSKIQEVGEKGIYRRVVKTFEVGGNPVDQQVQSSYELISPKKEVIIQNSKPAPKKKVVIQRPESVAEGPPELDKLNIKKTMTVESTAYTHTGNKTATGVEPREGLIAVDPKVIAMGSKVYVEGYGYAIAADTGGDIRGNRIDVFFSSLRQCIDWGRRPVHIYVLNSI